jgi:hypothetical protein
MEDGAREGKKSTFAHILYIGPKAMDNFTAKNEM